ncbi:Cro/CI family transcriptional regulator [Siccibacter colletis]|uniref:Cro/CI family transcriptional regulator n=1 Tax=Siccibacter colletis TaxID=1505757 RepID=UPI0028BDD0D1|nr:Cro/CI family transcriptional regulator [Siccibacter colletis]WNN49851.1 Cro/CI family transcriptional regulator [Siccibacter colletis]
MTTTELEHYFGSPNKAAEFFGVSPEAFYQWRTRPGQLIPKGRAAEADARTQGKLKFNASLYQKPSERTVQP